VSLAEPDAAPEALEGELLAVSALLPQPASRVPIKPQAIATFRNGTTLNLAWDIISERFIGALT
jgi:hypothetical protein